MKIIVMIMFRWFLCLLLVAGARGFSNPSIQENELGTTATACADMYCESLDSLELWLRTEYYCQGNSTTTSTTRSRRRLEEDKFSIFNYKTTKHVSGFICSIFGVLGMIIGLSLGKTYTYKYLNENSISGIVVINDGYESDRSLYLPKSNIFTGLYSHSHQYSKISSSDDY